VFSNIKLSKITTMYWLGSQSQYWYTTHIECFA